MSEITITIKEGTPLIEQSAIKIALQKVANNLNKKNIQWVAELSEKPNINSKLESAQSNAMLNMYL